MTVRLLTWNILLGGVRGTPVRDVVREVRPDVLLVNESPKQPVLWRRDCRRLAEGWQLRWVGGGRTAGSNLVAVGERVGVRRTHDVVLPQPRRHPRRGVAVAQLRVEGRLLGVVSCHLSLLRDRRPDEVRRVIELARELRGPVVLGGDLNEPPEGPCWRLLREAGFVDHGTREWRTFPADRPRSRIDALLVRGDAQVRHHGDPGVAADLLAAASDHRPVLLELDL